MRVRAPRRKLHVGRKFVVKTTSNMFSKKKIVEQKQQKKNLAHRRR
jgi:hypothetical protein